MKKLTISRLLSMLSLPLLIYGIIQIKLYGVALSGFIRPVLMIIFALMVILLPKSKYKWLCVPIIINLASILIEMIQAVPLYASYNTSTLIGFIIGNLPQILLLAMISFSCLNIIKNKKISNLLLLIFTLLYSVLVILAFINNLDYDVLSSFVLLGIYYIPNIFAGLSVFFSNK